MKPHHKQKEKERKQVGKDTKSTSVTFSQISQVSQIISLPNKQISSSHFVVPHPKRKETK